MSDQVITVRCAIFFWSLSLGYSGATHGGQFRQAAGFAAALSVVEATSEERLKRTYGLNIAPAFFRYPGMKSHKLLDMELFAAHRAG